MNHIYGVNKYTYARFAQKQIYRYFFKNYQSWIRIRIWWWNFQIRQKGPDPDPQHCLVVLVCNYILCYFVYRANGCCLRLWDTCVLITHIPCWSKNNYMWFLPFCFYNRQLNNVVIILICILDSFQNNPFLFSGVIFFKTSFHVLYFTFLLSRFRVF